MLKNFIIVWEMAKALNLQMKDSVYNFKLQAIFQCLTVSAFENIGRVCCQRGGIRLQSRGFSLLITQCYLYNDFYTKDEKVVNRLYKAKS